MNIKEKITEIIKNSDARYLTAKQIYSMAGVQTSFDRAVVKEVIYALTQAGTLFYDSRNRRYVVANKDEYAEAVVDGNNRGFGFLIMDDGHDLFVPAAKMKGALHRDTVLYRRVPGTEDEAEVVKILKRGMTEIVGTYDKQRGARFVLPDERKFAADIYIRRGRDMEARNGQKVVARITSYPSDGGSNPEGDIIQVLGYADDKNVDMMSVAYAYGIKKDFPAETEKRADKLPSEVSDADLQDRADFRKEIVFTIDGDDAKDLDDAVSAEDNGDGTFTLGVHIADVSHYVGTGDPIDKEAFRRGTSVYFPDAVFPMLPTKLSNGICSLYQGADRLTLSCIMKINDKGKVIGYEIKPSVIRSRHRLTYGEVQRIFDGDKTLMEKYADIADTLSVMKRLAETLIAKRSKRGNIDFETKEVSFVMKDGEVTDIIPCERTFAHRLIEEFMIIANETVAEYAAACEYPFVYRVHEKPDEEKLNVLLALMRGVGIEVKPVKEMRSSVLQHALAEAENTPYFHLINDVMLRTMQKAKYSPVNTGHFGLSSQCYCHFTSPIRRYPDLIVHRVLKTAVGGKMTEKALRAYSEICEEASRQSSLTEKTADEAERKADDVKKCAYAERLIGDSFDAIISGVTENGIFAELPNTVEGFIETDKLAEKLVFDREKFMLFNESRKYALGDKIRVTMESVNRSACKIYFSPEKAVD